MKKLSFILFFFALIFNISAQKKGEGVVDPWQEPTVSRMPYMQGKDGIIVLEITNTAETQEECIIKAKQQAIYAVIFTGYTEGNNIPGAAALSQSGVGLYSEKEEFFRSFFTDVTKYAGYVTAAKLNTAKPVEKLEKKKVQAAVIVSIEAERLRKDLEAQNIIKGMAAFGVKPKILILPSDDWYYAHPHYIKGKDDQGKIIPDHIEASHDPLISSALSDVSNKFGGPNGAFEVMNIEAALGKNSIQEFKDAQRPDSKKGSYLDAIMNTVSADMIVQVDIVETELERGLKTRMDIRLISIDPYTGLEWFKGKLTTKITTGDDRQQQLTAAMNGAADDFRPRLLDQFKLIIDGGLSGEITISFLDNVEDFDFDTKFKGEEGMEAFSQIVDDACVSNANESIANGVGSPTTRVYSVKIPYYVQNKRTGKSDRNSFEKFGYKVGNTLSDYIGENYKVERIGLGKSELIITGRK
jgi:hypothetical protein